MIGQRHADPGRVHPDPRHCADDPRQPDLGADRRLAGPASGLGHVERSRSHSFMAAFPANLLSTRSFVLFIVHFNLSPQHLADTADGARVRSGISCSTSIAGAAAFPGRFERGRAATFSIGGLALVAAKVMHPRHLSLLYERVRSRLPAVPGTPQSLLRWRAWGEHHSCRRMAWARQLHRTTRLSTRLDMARVILACRGDVGLCCRCSTACSGGRCMSYAQPPRHPRIAEKLA